MFGPVHVYYSGVHYYVHYNGLIERFVTRAGTEFLRKAKLNAATQSRVVGYARRQWRNIARRMKTRD